MKRMNRKLRRTRELVRAELEPRLERLEAENQNLKSELDALRATAAAEPAPAQPAPEPAARASHVIQPSGGGLPAQDLRAAYDQRVAALRPGDVAGLMEVKRDFRKRGLEVY